MDEGKRNGHSKKKSETHTSSQRGLLVRLAQPLTIREESTSEHNERYAEEKRSRAAQLSVARDMNVLTFFSWIVATLALVALFASIQVSRNAFKVGQRPWVGPEFPVLHAAQPIFADVSVGKHLTWNYLIKNYGNSPALRARGHARAYIFEPGKTSWDEIRSDVSALPLLDNTEVTIFNGGESPDYGVSNVAVSEDLLAKLKAGERLLLLYGKMEYFDEFTALHHTTFCIIYLPSAGDDDGSKSGWHSCPINEVAD